MKNIGASPFRVLATQPHALLCWDLRLAHTEQTELGEYSLATAVANGCFGQCTKLVLQIRRPPKTEMMVCNSLVHG
jgi:hypothetical protein